MASPPRQVRRLRFQMIFKGENIGEPDSNSVQFRVQDHRGIYGELLRKSEGAEQTEFTEVALSLKVFCKLNDNSMSLVLAVNLIFNVSVSVSKTMGRNGGL